MLRNVSIQRGTCSGMEEVKIFASTLIAVYKDNNKVGATTGMVQALKVPHRYSDLKVGSI